MSTETMDRRAARLVPRESLMPASDERCFGPAALVALLAQLPVAVFLADRQGRLVFANVAARRDVPQLPDTVGAILARALLTGETVRDELVEIAEPGARRWWAGVSATPLASAVGHIDGAVLTMTDLTDRVRLASWEPVMESLTRL
jgi:PAS domain-containing protein